MQVNGIGGRPEGGFAPADVKQAQNGGSGESEIKSLEQQIKQENRELEKDRKELMDAAKDKDNNKSQMIRARIQTREMSVQSLQAQIESIRAASQKSGSQSAKGAQAKHKYDRVELDERLTGQKLDALAAAGQLVDPAAMNEEEE